MKENVGGASPGHRRKDEGIWKAPNGQWGVDYRTPDNHRHKYVVGPKQLAKDHYRSKMAEISELRYRPQPERMTFAELARKNLESKRGKISDRSYTSDVGRTKALVKTLGEVLIDQITPLMVDSLLSRLREAGRPRGGPGRPSRAAVLQGATCNRYRAALSSHFSYAVRMKLLTENPVRAVAVYKEPECRKRFLGVDEEAALFASIRRLHPEREGEAILILHTGLRKGGMFSLLWQEVDLDRRQITVHSKETTYFVELNSAAVAALRDLHARSAGRAKVCQSRSYSRSMDWFTECVQAAGIEDFTLHDLRHTFGSRAIEAGADLTSVQEWLGHKDIQTTRRRYVHLSTEHKLEQIEKLVKAKDKRRTNEKEDAAQVVELKAVKK